MSGQKKPEKDKEDCIKFSGSISFEGKNNPFDLWLHRGLHQLFDDVAQEPIPDDLLNLFHQGSKKAQI